MKPHTSTQHFAVILAALLLTACTGAITTPISTTPPVTPAASRPPNILIILTDDQRYDTMDYMPQTTSLIFDRGMTFSKAYVTTPLCCPSRSTILTGMYAHSHGVLTNFDALNTPTFVEHLHDAGYTTGLVGKYLNSWDGTPRPEFDSWVDSTRKQYNDPLLNIDGEWQTVAGYQTEIFGDFALQFLDHAAAQEKPWLLYYSVRAPHNPATPAGQYNDLYADLPPFRPPSFNEEDISDKPFAGRTIPLDDRRIAANDNFRLRQLRTLKSVDDTVGDILQSLADRGMLENTAIFYMSDNGILWGEHRLSGSKVFGYEPSIHVPFGFYYPRLGAPPRVIDSLVANVDIAPTIYELAGIRQPPEVEGMSLLPLIRGEGDWRSSLLIESWGVDDSAPDDAPEDAGTMRWIKPYIAIHTGRYVLIRTIDVATELYDLESDPYQLQSVSGDPAYAEIEADLNAQADAALPVFLARLEAMGGPTPTVSP